MAGNQFSCLAWLIINLKYEKLFTFITRGLIYEMCYKLVIGSYLQVHGKLIPRPNKVCDCHNNIFQLLILKLKCRQGSPPCPLQSNDLPVQPCSCQSFAFLCNRGFVFVALYLSFFVCVCGNCLCMFAYLGSSSPPST